MTTQRSSRNYHCCNDCRQTGCPGHEVELIFHHTSDTVSIVRDGKHQHTYDKTEWRVLVNLDRVMRE